MGRSSTKGSKSTDANGDGSWSKKEWNDWYQNWNDGYQNDWYSGYQKSGKGKGKSSEKGAGKASAKPGEGIAGTAGAETRQALATKPYKASLDAVCEKTAVRMGDFDRKAMGLLDYHQEHGKRADEACQFIIKTLEGRQREMVANWRAYLYVLLKQFDEEAYKAVKASTEGQRRSTRGGAERLGSTDFAGMEKPFANFKWNLEATEFVPKSEPAAAAEDAKPSKSAKKRGAKAEKSEKGADKAAAEKKEDAKEAAAEAPKEKAPEVEKKEEDTGFFGGLLKAFGM